MFILFLSTLLYHTFSPLRYFVNTTFQRQCKLDHISPSQYNYNLWHILSLCLCLCLSLSLFLRQDFVLPCSSGCPQIHYVAHGGLELLILLPQLTGCWDYGHVPLCPSIRASLTQIDAIFFPLFYFHYYFCFNTATRVIILLHNKNPLFSL
jgi:hypothetical protein